MKVVLLSGGVGGARFARGLLEAVPARDVTVIGNVADDVEVLGLAVSPDLDSIVYALAGLNDEERGWGRADESWRALETVSELGGEDWFKLGDRDLDDETHVDYDDRDFVPEAAAAASYVAPDAPIADAAFYEQAGKEIVRRIADARTLTVFRNRALKLYSRPGETEEQFTARADEAAQAAADEETAKIRDRLEAKQDRLEKALETARRRTEELETDQRSRTTTELLAGAGTVLGVLLGGRGRTRTIASAGRAIGSAASRRGMTARAGERRRTAEAKVESSEQSLEELEQEIVDEVAEIDEEWDAKAKEIDAVEVRLEPSDVRLVELALVWVPTD